MFGEVNGFAFLLFGGTLGAFDEILVEFNQNQSLQISLL